MQALYLGQRVGDSGRTGLCAVFNDNSILNHYQYEGEIDRLKAEIKVNRDSLEYYRAMNSRLDTDREAMEQIVREQYHMQRPNEDVYIVE